jgi:hypothetical protein
MAKLIASRGSQWPLVAEFVFNFDDTMLDINGALKDFKSFAASTVVDTIKLPVNAVIISGEVVTETAITGSTAYNVSVGDATNTARYLGVTDKKAAGRTALVPTGYVSNGDQIRLTVTPTVADATLGKVSLRVMYVIRNRVNETQTH